MKLYSVSLLAMKPSSEENSVRQLPIIRHSAITLTSMRLLTAKRDADELVKRLYPESEGWVNHHTVVQEMDVITDLSHAGIIDNGEPPVVFDVH